MAHRIRILQKRRSLAVHDGQWKKQHLDIKGLNYLLLAGRTFISRKLDASNEDILMGESISARTNQLAYYVPLEYVSGDGRSLDQKKYAGI